MKLLNITLKLSLVMLLVLSLTFCSSNDDNNGDEPNPGTLPPPIEEVDPVTNDPGKIPGFGKEEGEPTGTPFTLPTGIALNSEIIGANSDLDLTTVIGGGDIKVDFKVGSGASVVVHFELTNTTKKDIVVIFPARLILKSKPKDGKLYYQNGLLLKETKVLLPSNKTTKVGLLVYSTNASKVSSMERARYEFTAISNSSLLINLTTRLSGKKINYEEYTEEERNQNYGYHFIVSQLQMILYTLTDSNNPLSERQLQYIKDLPNK